jgi:hypothetical protein
MSTWMLCYKYRGCGCPGCRHHWSGMLAADSSWQARYVCVCWLLDVRMPLQDVMFMDIPV